MLVGYMRTSSADERQSVDLQRDALIGAGVDERHLYQDKASGARDDRPGLKACLEFLHSGDVLVVWKIDRLGRSLSHLIRIVEEIKTKGVAFRSLTEQMDTTTPHGEFLFNIFGSLAQYERALIKERVMAGLAAARRRGRKGGRPPALDPEKVEQIIAALDGGTSKASVCRTFKVPRSTLIDTLSRVGWTGPGAGAQKPERSAPKKVASLKGSSGNC
jgi:DNA invertase Pin-like site-specific DNA recombinase